MVLGEVLNFPGSGRAIRRTTIRSRRSTFYRFDHLQGFGAGFGNGGIYATHHNG